MLNKGTFKKLIIPALTLASSALVSAPILADQREDQGLYLGGAWGLAKIEGGEFDEDNNVPQIFGGIQIFPFLGVEGSYYDFGDQSDGFVDAETDGYSVALTGRLPLSESFALYAKLGPLWWETDIDAGPFSGDIDGEDLMFGAGASFEVTENLDLRLSYDWVDWDLDSDDIDGLDGGEFDSDARMISLGLKLEF